MQKNKQVFIWETFYTFIRQTYRLEPSQRSHDILDVLAKDLYTGDLQRRDTSGYPIEPWQRPSDLAESYLFVDEVNARPVMKKWLLEWNPERDNRLTPQEEVDKYGWLGALKLEEARHRALLKAGGIRFHITQRTAHLHAYAVKHNITNRRSEIPAIGTIRNAVFYRKPP
jgi:hypothetical protein